MTVGVCGIGQIGLGVALAARRAGFRVLVYGRNAEKLRQAEGRLEKLNEWTNQHLGSLETKSGTITYVGELAELDTEADLIVEGIAEDLNAKVALFRQLDGCVRRGGRFGYRHVRTQHHGTGGVCGMRKPTRRSSLLESPPSDAVG